MRDMLHHREKNDWFVTRAEIVRKLRTDPEFEQRWRAHQEVLDQAVHDRIVSNRAMREDVAIDVVQTYLETVFEGFVVKLAAGEPVERLEAMLSLVEQSVRKPVSEK